MPLRRDPLPRSSLPRSSRRHRAVFQPGSAGFPGFAPSRARRPRRPLERLLLIAVLLAVPPLATRWSLAAELLAQAGALSTPPAPMLPAPASSIPAAAPANPSPRPAPAAGAPAAGSDGMVTIESDSQRADNRTGIVTALGNVRIVYPARGLVAMARQAQYFTREARLVLSGDVDVVDGDGQRIRAERLVYQLDSERLQAQPAAGRQVVTRLRLQAPAGTAPRPLMP